MLRKIVLVVISMLLPMVSSAQFEFGPGASINIAGVALPTCEAATNSNYVIVDAVSATTCAGGALPLFSELNYCVCDKNTLQWTVLVSTIGDGVPKVDSMFGRTGNVVAQANDYSISQVTGGIASSTLASTASGQGATLIGVEDAGANFTGTDVEAVLTELNALRLTHAGNVSAHHVATVNTNAQTACIGSESLRGDGSCAVPAGGGFTPNVDPGIDHSSYVAGHTDGTNAAAGFAITGVDAIGNATGAFDVQTQIESNAHTADASAHHTATVDTNTTNLGTTVSALDLTVTSDTGTNATLPAASATGPVAGVMTGADKTKLDGIETAATADQSNAEIETGYNAQVLKVSAGEIAAGTEITVRRFSPDDVEAMVAAHAPPGGTTNLSTNISNIQVQIANDNGTPATVGTATALLAGIFTAADWIKLDAISGTNTGDEIAATDLVAGILEIAIQAEVDAGVLNDKTVTPQGLDGWPGSGNITSVGIVTGGQWQAGVIQDAFVSTGLTINNLSGVNTGDELAATEAVAGVLEVADQTETDAGALNDRAITPQGLNAWPGSDAIHTLSSIYTDNTPVDAFRCTPITYSGSAFSFTADAAPGGTLMDGLALNDTVSSNNIEILREGILDGLDTANGEGWGFGTPLYLKANPTSTSPDCGEGLTSVKPTGTARVQLIGVSLVNSATVGSIFINLPVNVDELRDDVIGTDELDDGTDPPGAGEWLQVDGVDQAGIVYRNDTEARTDLGLVIGTDVQAFDAELDTISGLVETTGNVMVAVGSAWASVAQPIIDCTNCTNLPAGSSPFTDGTSFIHPTTSTKDLGNDNTGSNWKILDTGAATFSSVTVPPPAASSGTLSVTEGTNFGTNTYKWRGLDAGWTNNIEIVWPDDNAPAATEILGIASVSAGVITLEWQVDATAAGGIAGAPLEECFPLYAPSAGIQLTDDIQSVWRASAALTITEVWCETDVGTVNMDIQIDDGTPADVMGVDLVCAATAVSDSAGLTGGMAAGDRLDFLITSVATAPKRLSLCIGYDYD